MPHTLMNLILAAALDLFMFGGLVIDWKSSVQCTVTRSTTEAELLSRVDTIFQIYLKLNSTPILYMEMGYRRFHLHVCFSNRSPVPLLTSIVHLKLQQL